MATKQHLDSCQENESSYEDVSSIEEKETWDLLPSIPANDVNELSTCEGTSLDEIDIDPTENKSTDTANRVEIGNVVFEDTNTGMINTEKRNEKSSENETLGENVPVVTKTSLTAGPIDYIANDATLRDVTLDDTAQEMTNPTTDTDDATFADDTNFCEPCQHDDQTVMATTYCVECEEKYCDSCKFIHGKQKNTKSHIMVDVALVLSSSKPCKPCLRSKKQMEASYICEDCDENLCDECKVNHVLEKVNVGHKVRALLESLKCDICKYRDNLVQAVCYCLDCPDSELFCEKCSKKHTSMKQSRSHKLSTDLTPFMQYDLINQSLDLNAAIAQQSDVSTVDKIQDKGQRKMTKQGFTCEPCLFQNKDEIATHYCVDCDERYCNICTKRHQGHKRTCGHELVDLELLVQSKLCEPCESLNKQTGADYFCDNCNEYQCEECMNYHCSQKQQRDHNIVSTQLRCEECIAMGQNVLAKAFCIHDMEPLCTNCAKSHIAMKSYRDHHISENMCDYILRNYLATREEMLYSIDEEEKLREQQNMPGTPYVTETENMSNSLFVKWKPASLSENESYQLQYKQGTDGKWRIYPNSTTSTTFQVAGLQPNTSYIFRVRIVNDLAGTEGVFSSESESITTGESVALATMKKSKLIYNDPVPAYALPVKEIRGSRNDQVKTRKLYLGRKGNNAIEKNVMLVGATGSGKSTLINAMANYIMGVTWEDPFRFTLEDIETCVKEKVGDQAHSQTDWVTCYIINNTISSNIKYTLNLIDTPGFGDTRGLEQDQKVVGQIKELFTADGKQGVTTIDAVCFVLKAPDSRLTATQLYIFESILSLFGHDIKENICTLITFADGQRPPVLAALEALESKPLPYEKYFTFNNSALYVENSNKDPDSLSRTFWEMGMQSCKSFFQHLDTLNYKSLRLTSEVLDQRERLENTLQHLTEEVSVGLAKICNLEDEIELFTRFESKIRDNKEFTYEVNEQVQEKIDISGTGKYTTNCLQCNFTCHENCKIADDSKKMRCVAIGGNGQCTVCTSKCHWTQHHNNPFIIKWVAKKMTRKYSEMQKAYEEATQKSLTQKQLIEQMNMDIERRQNTVTQKMDLVASYNNRLKEIALRPDPLGTSQYLDLMIDSERREKKFGYEARIDVIERLKKRNQYDKDVEIFKSRVRSTRRTLQATRSRDLQPKGFIGNVRYYGKKVYNAVKS